MRSTYDEFAKELAELRSLVASITPVNSALAGHHDSLVREYLTIRRRFDYAAFVVALYASFEKFAENLVAAYARLATLRNRYDALPAGLTKKHMTRSAEILARGRLGEGRYLGVSEIDLVKNLFNCLSGASPYALNDVAVVAHDANLWFEELVKLFATVGIDNVGERARRADAMLTWYCASNSLMQPPQDGVRREVIQQRLDELVERRNQVTHRGGSPDELLGAAAMADLVDFVEALAGSIFALTVCSYLSARYVESGEVEQLQLREGPLKNRTVVVVERPNRRLYVGQPVFALIESAGARWGRILDLQLDDVSTTSVDETATADEVGLAVSFKCPNGVALYLLGADDEVVWSPESARGEYKHARAQEFEADPEV
ncbi:MAG TPA: MAE_28990/MAE_18760 family HEPN-like nuclease [Thermoanaerobaculia bacterium]|nr:MAE_28990/MAE_18760 family HEPN-like nuclease [Thermoanaerobaculia bacterium]